MSLTARQLDAYLQARGTAAWRWDTSNCAHFAGGWICWATQDDPLDGLPPTPTPSAARALVDRLGGSMQAAVTLRLGREPVAPALARVGDIVLLPGGVVGGALGICAGLSALALDDAGAVTHVDMATAVAAWRLRP